MARAKAQMSNPYFLVIAMGLSFGLPFDAIAKDSANPKPVSAPKPTSHMENQGGCKTPMNCGPAVDTEGTVKTLTGQPPPPPPPPPQPH
jgi:hypothetical protein